MNLRLLILISLGIIQLAVPGFMIYRQEQILHRGHEFKFKTAPVDPYDAFRGRYVALQFDVTSNDKHPNFPPQTRQIWVRFETDPQGFAKITEESAKPLTGDDVLLASLRYDRLQLPFDRYYMDENKAPKADIAYRNNSRSDSKNAYVTVRLLNGQGAIEELYIDDKSITEYLRSPSKNQENSPPRSTP